jgi:hypothetical protein
MLSDPPAASEFNDRCPTRQQLRRLVAGVGQPRIDLPILAPAPMTERRYGILERPPSQLAEQVVPPRLPVWVTRVELRAQLPMILRLR